MPPIFRGFEGELFWVVVLRFGAFFFGAFGLDSLRIPSEFEPHCLKDLTLEWLEILVLFEQDTVGFVLGKHGRHAQVLVEFDLEGPPALVDLYCAQLASHQMHDMEGQDGQEQMGFNLLIFAVIDWAEAQVGFHRSVGVFNFSQLPVCSRNASSTFPLPPV